MYVTQPSRLATPGTQQDILREVSRMLGSLGEAEA